MGMKVSVSLPGEDVAFLDSYAGAHQLPSRSAVVRTAIRALRLGDLRDAYSEAWTEWEASGEADAWDSAAGDGA